MSFHNFDCPVKNQVRSQFFGHWTRLRGSQAASLYVCLPAAQCLCVKEAKRLGIVTPQETYIVWAERDPSIRRKIDAYLDKQGYFHRGFASFKKLNKHLATLAQDGVSVDLAYIDLCGEMTPDTKAILASLDNTLASDSLVGVTLQDYARHPNTRRYNTQPRIIRRGRKAIKNSNQDTPTLGNHTTTQCTVIEGVVGHITEALPDHKVTQVLRYRSPSKRTNMSLTVLT